METINEQLEMDVLKTKGIQTKADIPDEDYCEIDEGKNLLYLNRLGDLIEEVSKYIGLNGIQKTKEGMVRLQKNSKYIISYLIIETLGEVDKCGRKQIRSEDVDKALDNITSKASGIDNAILMLKDNIIKLDKAKKDNSISKVNEFINYIDKQDEVKKC